MHVDNCRSCLLFNAGAFFLSLAILFGGILPEPVFERLKIGMNLAKCVDIVGRVARFVKD